MPGDLALLTNGVTTVNLMETGGGPPFGPPGFAMPQGGLNPQTMRFVSARTPAGRRGGRLIYRYPDQQTIPLELALYGSSQADLAARGAVLQSLAESAASADLRRHSADALPVWLVVRPVGTTYERYAWVKEADVLVPGSPRGFWGRGMVADGQSYLTGITLVLTVGAIYGPNRPHLVESGHTATTDPDGYNVIEVGRHYLAPDLLTQSTRAGGIRSMWFKPDFSPTDGVQHVIWHDENDLLKLEKGADNVLRLTIRTAAATTKTTFIGALAGLFDAGTEHLLTVQWGDIPGTAGGLRLYLDTLASTSADAGIATPLYAAPTAFRGGIGGRLFVGCDNAALHPATGGFADYRDYRTVDGVRFRGVGSLFLSGRERKADRFQNSFDVTVGKYDATPTAWDIDPPPGDMEPEVYPSFAFELTETPSDGVATFTYANRVGPTAGFGHILEAESFSLIAPAAAQADATASNGNRVSSTGGSAAIVTPPAPSVANVGTPGTTTLAYALYWLLAEGVSQIGPWTQTNTSNDVLDTTNFNRISWAAPPSYVLGVGVVKVAVNTLLVTQSAAVGGLQYDDNGRPPESTSFTAGAPSVARTLYKTIDALDYAGSFQLRAVVQKHGNAAIQARLSQGGVNDTRALPLQDISYLPDDTWCEVSLGYATFPLFAAPQGASAPVTIHLFDSGTATDYVRWDCLLLFPYESAVQLYSWRNNVYALSSYDRLAFDPEERYRWSGDPANPGFISTAGKKEGGVPRLVVGRRNRWIGDATRLTGKRVVSDRIFLYLEVRPVYKFFW